MVPGSGGWLNSVMAALLQIRVNHAAVSNIPNISGVDAGEVDLLQGRLVVSDVEDNRVGVGVPVGVFGLKGPLYDNLCGIGVFGPRVLQNVDGFHLCAAFDESVREVVMNLEIGEDDRPGCSFLGMEGDALRLGWAGWWRSDGRASGGNGSSRRGVCRACRGTGRLVIVVALAYQPKDPGCDDDNGPLGGLHSRLFAHSQKAREQSFFLADDSPFIRRTTDIQIGPPLVVTQSPTL